MILVLDTSNLLHVTGVLEPASAGWGLEELIAALNCTLGGSDRAVLVCDGLPAAVTAPVHPRIEVVYAGRGRTADDLIAGIVAGAPDPRRLLVVSSDRQVRRGARRRRCRTLDSPGFLRRLAARLDRADRAPSRPRRPEGPLPPEEISEWTRIFGAAESAPDVEASFDDLLRRVDALRAAPEDRPPNEPPPSARPARNRPRRSPPRPPRPPPRPAPGDQEPPFTRDVIDQAEQLWSDDGNPPDG